MSSMLRYNYHSYAIAFAMGACMGCGSGSMSSLEGTVTLDGAPVEGSSELYGTVSFYPEGGSGAPAVGIISSGGRYSVKTGAQDGLQPGNYLVAVAVKKIHPPAEPGGLTRPERITPVKYSKAKESGFRVEVKPGNNTFDFALVSDNGRSE